MKFCYNKDQLCDDERCYCDDEDETATKNVKAVIDAGEIIKEHHRSIGSKGGKATWKGKSKEEIKNELNVRLERWRNRKSKK